MTTSFSTRSFRISALAAALILSGCATQQPAPIVDGTTSPAPVATSLSTASSSGVVGKTYTVKPRDTLYQIARQNNVSINDLRQWNQISDPNQLRIGQVLRLYSPESTGAAPSLGGAGNAQVSAIADAKPVTPQTPKIEVPVTETPTPTPAPTPALTTPDEKSVVRAADANLVNWGWPANGRLIQGFNTNTKGIDIEGQPGDPIFAAGAGQVMYSGNGVRGLGNLIIINHTGGFITAYAHNRTLLVKAGDKVTLGQRIAELGQTDTTSPRLHFEVRRQGTPVDPLKYLPHR